VVGVRVKKLNEHTSFVNSCCPSKKGNLLVSGSDDKAVKVPPAIQNPQPSSHSVVMDLAVLALTL
jgi:WD40 repeat protein